MTKSLLVSAALLSLVLVAPARGQVISMSGGASASYFLLFNPVVQKELKLSEEQKKKIQAKIEELTPQGPMIQLGGSNKSASGTSGDRKSGDAQGNEGAKVTFQIGGGGGKLAATPPIVIGGGGEGGVFRMPDLKKIDTEVDKLLDEKQRARLKQLNLQTQGMMALAQDPVAAEVGLEDDQREMLKHILQENSQKTKDLLAQLREEGSFSPQGFGEHMRKQRETTEKDIGLLLTEEQKAKWAKLTGPKLDLGFGPRR